MDVKQLREYLSEFPQDKEVYIEWGYISCGEFSYDHTPLLKKHISCDYNVVSFGTNP